MQRKYGGLELWGCDIEALAVAVLNAWQRRNTRLNPDDFDDALAFIVAAGWELSTRYEAGRYSSFHDYAKHILALRVTDWLRGNEGRTRWQFDGHVYEREPQRTLSLDGPATGADEHPLGEAVAARDSDDPAARDPDRGAGLLAARSVHRRRDLRVLREADARLAAERARRPRQAA